MKKYLCFLFLLMLCSITHAATPSTEGTEFWVTFMNNFNTQASSDELQLKLIVSSRESATVTMRNPQTGWRASLSVGANQVAEYVLPNSEVYTYSAGQVEKKGVVVTSTAPVSLYAANFKEHTYDATIVMPTTALGTDYVVQMYEADMSSKEIAVVATADNTQVTITPHARTTSGQAKGMPFTITLRQGESYMLMSNDSGNDFSGTCIQADKPVAVFAGHSCLYVPVDNPTCDHIVEQQLPTQMWGKQFAVTKTKEHNGDRVMITARNNNTKVYVNGNLQTTLNELESYEFRLTDNSAYIETTEPAACYLYVEGAKDNNMVGDPSSVHISPIEQKIKRLTFATFQTDVSRTHYVNVVTTEAGARAMKLDGVSIADQFTAVEGNSALRFAQIHIQHGIHTLETNNDGFTGYVYGVGWCESYAYTIGSATVPLDGQIVVDGESRSDVEYDETRCYKKSIRFEPHANVEFNTIEWSFGDGTISTQKVVNHTYTAPGKYRIRMIITNEDGRDTAYTNLTLIEQLRDTVYAQICKGDVYTFGGRTYNATGKYDVKFTSSGGCDSIVTLNLVVNETYFVVEQDSFPIGSSYRWHRNWYRESGTYYDTLITVAGCDSIIELNLIKTDPSEIMYDTICWQPTYEFKGCEFKIPSYQGFENEDYIDYVLEYRDKDACISYKMNLAIAPIVDGTAIVVYDTIQKGSIYEWFGDNYTETGTYYKTVYQACECAIDYTLHLEVLPFPLTKLYVELCHGETYTFQNKEYIGPGVYYDTVWTVTGVDAIYEIKLVDVRKRTEINASYASSYTFNGKTYTESGTYIDTLQSTIGCDSIVTLNLTILPKGADCIEAVDLGLSVKWATCNVGAEYPEDYGDYFAWGETSIKKYYTWDTYKYCKGTNKTLTKYCNKTTYGNNGFADYKTVLDPEDDVATVNWGEEWRIPTYEELKELREQCTWTWITQNGVNGYKVIGKNGNSIFLPAAGFKKNSSVSNVGKEGNYFTSSLYPSPSSTRGLTIYEKSIYYGSGHSRHEGESIRPVYCEKQAPIQTYEFVEKDTICGNELPYIWRGKECNVAGVYYDSLKTSVGGDSVYVLELAVLPEVVGKEESITICEGEVYKWNGKEYSVAGVYVDTLQSVQGCDSIVKLNLIVLPEDECNEPSDCIEAVDLGLSVMWATCNVGAEYPEDYGDYFAWGETQPKSNYNFSTYIHCNGSNNTLIKYCSDSSYGNNGFTDNKTVLDSEDDAATVNWGDLWRMPTDEEIIELREKCTWTWATQNGVNGYKVVGINGNSIFLPAAGCMVKSSFFNGESVGYYWISTLYGDYSHIADDIDFDSNGIYWNGSGDRTLGQSVRPVYPKEQKTIQTYEFVDKDTICGNELPYIWRGKECDAAGVYYDSLKTALGGDSVYVLELAVLPENECNGQSDCIEAVDLGLSVMWATCNVGAEYPEDYGDYFAWGETQSKENYDWSTYKYCKGTYKTMTKYCTNSSYGYNGFTDNKTILDPEDDAATVNWGGSWRMPTDEEMTELRTLCKWTWTTQNGVNGYKVVGPNGNSIFLPAAGYLRGTSLRNVGSYGFYWSSSLNASKSNYAYYVYFDSSGVGRYDNDRSDGRSVRPVCSKEQAPVQTYEFVDKDTICGNELPYIWRGKECNVAGVYYDSLKTVLGGDSVYVLELAVLPENECNGQSDCIEAVDLGLSVMWATCNVGAEYPEDYGDYFAWGETQPKEQYYWTTYKYCNGSFSVMIKYCTDSSYGNNGFTDNKTVLDSEDDVATVNWGGSWRMPTYEELTELREQCKWTWTTQNGVKGYKVVGPNGNTIFLPAAGYIGMSGLGGAGLSGYYWSSSLNDSVSYNAYSVYFRSSNVRSHDGHRDCGLSVRPVYPKELIPTYEFVDKDTICGDELPYIWREKEYNASGVYYDSLKTTLGGDSIYVLELAVLPEVVGKEESITICEGEVYKWNGKEYSVAGEYVDTLQSAQGCDSIVTLNLTVKSICECLSGCDGAVDLGLSVNWAPFNIGATKPEELGYYLAWGETAPQQQNYSWQSYKYCAGSNKTMTKYCTNSTYGTIDNKTELDPEDDAAIANLGGSWRLPTKDEYAELIAQCTWTWTTINGVNGCKVTGKNGNSIFLPAAGCMNSGGPYDVGRSGYYYSSTLRSDQPYNAYDVDVTSSGGRMGVGTRNYGQSMRAVCPKNYENRVTIDNVTICYGDKYNWNGVEYVISGEYIDTLQNVHGCDSVVKLNLTILSEVQGKEESATICYGESYVWNSKEYSVSGVYKDTLQSYQGCDSVVTLNLTVLPEVIGKEESATICIGESYVWNGKEYPEFGVYKDTLQSAQGCDSVIVLTLTARSEAECNKQSDCIEAVDLGLSVMWATCNVGAESPEDYGDYFAWGETEPKEKYDWSTYLHCKGTNKSLTKYCTTSKNGYNKFVDNKTVLDAEDDAAVVNWGGYWRIPTDAEVLELRNQCSWVWTTQKGVKGYKVTGPNGNSIFLPAAGYINGESLESEDVGVYGRYWFNTLKENNPIYANFLNFYSTTVVSGFVARFSGISIRPVCSQLPQTYEFVENDTICGRELPYIWRGKDCNATGVYYDSLKSVFGEDSVYVLNLNVIPATIGEEENAIICYGESYRWRGVDYLESGKYKDTLQSAQGCDSIVILNLMVLPEIVSDEEKVVVCYGQSYNWNGEEYSKSGVYIDTLQSAQGCDSIVTLNLTVLPEVVGKEVSATICYGESYKWQGVDYFVSGVYKDTLQSAQGCDSIVALSLTVLPEVVGEEENATVCYGESYKWRGVDYLASGVYKDTLQSAQGCDSIVTLNLTVLPEVVGKGESVTVCYGESYKWQGVDYSLSGVYKDTLQNTQGCDSIVTLNLTVLPEVVGKEESATICYGESYKWQGVDYSLSGVYKDTLQSAQGCDSIVTLNLTVLPEVVGKEENATVCYGESYKWQGVDYSLSGVYKDTLQNTQGCDSIVTLNLTVLPEVVGKEESTTICYGESYNWNGDEYVKSGVYIDTLQSYQGCDSIVTLNLTVLPEVVGKEENVTICYGLVYKWNSKEYSKSGVYKDTLQSTHGCDSVVTLCLTVLPEVASTEESVTVCYGESYRWQGVDYSVSGVYKDTLQSAQGCDSIIILNFTVLPEVVGKEESATICYGESYKWCGGEYSKSGVYRDTLQNYLGCDSIVILNLTILPKVIDYEESATICYGEVYNWQGVYYSVSGVYKDTLRSAQGCDSVITLNLTVLPEVIGTEESVTVCYGESYRWQNVDYFVSGVYKDTLQNELGCDSIVTLNLMILPTYYFADTITINRGESYQWRDRTLEEAGVYYDSLMTEVGCDSVYFLNLIVEDVVVQSINIAEQCAGSGVMEVELVLQKGSVESVMLEFSQDAIDAGLTNTTLPYTEPIEVHYNNVRAGVYKVTVSGLLGETEVFEQQVDVTFLYPSSVLKQHWNDVIAVLTHDYNGGYNFVGFKWYKNGAEILGETHSYINQQLEFGAEYSALLTEDNGTQLMTCPLVATEHVDISLYPTLLSAAQRVKCKVSETSVVYIYDMMGNLVLELNVESGETELEMPYVAGVYMAKIVTASSEERNIKLIVR